jgi:RND family efflux transporter MFP subunit
MNAPNRSAWAVFAMMLACAALAGCAKKPAKPPPPTVTVATPLRETIVDWDDYVGQFVAVDSVDIRPRVSGYLQTVGFIDGAVVHKGQVLFVIDPRPYQAALDQAKGQEAHAEASVADAKSQLERGQTLLTAHAISQQAFDTLAATEHQDEADVLSAKAQVNTAALNLEFTRVTSPMNGRISDRRVAPGNLVTADTTVLTNIVNLDPIRFAFTGSEALYLKRQREAGHAQALAVEIKLQDEPSYRWKGRLEFVDNALDTSSGTIRGRAVVDNPANFLTPGMFGHMRLRGADPYAALLVPDQAIVTDQTREVVYVVDASNTVHERDVALGPLFNGLRVIKGGLGPNDRVVIDGVQRARPDQKVTPASGEVKQVPTSPTTSPQEQTLSPPAATATLADAGQ